jgi:hypothetical protein
MSSADFLLYKPLQLSGAVSFSRSSPKWVYDRTGTLVEVPANALSVTYDPADLSKAPWALIEPESRNYLRNSTMVGAAAGAPGTKPSSWGFLDGVDGVVLGISANVVDLPVEAGVNCIDLRYQGTASASGSLYVRFEFNETVAAAAGQNWASSFFYRMRPSSGLPASIRSFVTERSGSSHIQQTNGDSIPVSGLPLARYSQSIQISNLATGFIHAGIAIAVVAGQVYDFTIRIGLPQLERDRVTSPVKTSGSAVTRAADVVGAGAGLVYSSVAITEPLWVAGTYAQGAKVRDGDNFVFESLAGSNSAPLTEKTKWLPLGKTNQLKMFDKAVNSQTTAPDSLTVVVKPGQLANTLTLLNIAGAEVTVTQSESGYTRQRALATHNVLSWYDFYYQEPQWIGDTVFADMPPYLNSLITVHVKSPGNIAGLGGFFLGRPKFIGKTQWGLKAGILSYSSQEADTFGNVTLMKRASAKKMNFEVAVPRGYEDEVYRFMTAADNEEMIAIASTNWAMTLSYGYLGQWELPLGIEGEKMPVEWRGLI